MANPLHRLDRLGILRYPQTIRGASGGVITLWVNSAIKSWGAWNPLPHGSEFVAAGADRNVAVGTFHIRHRTDVKNTWRVLLDGVLYDIIQILEINRRGYLQLWIAVSKDHTSIEANSQVFEVTVSEGAETVVVVYPTAFSSAPTSIHPTLIVPEGQPVFYFGVISESRTASGCTIQLGAAAPAAGYKFSLQVTL